MESIDIGIIAHHLDKGNGIDTAVVRFAEGLSKRNNVTLISSRNGFKTEVPFFRLKQDGVKILTAHRILNKLNLDVLSSHFVPSNFIASRTKFFHAMHEAGMPDFRLMRSPKDRLFWLYVRELTRLSLKRADIVFPISAYIKEELNKKYNYNTGSYVLPYGLKIPEAPEKLDENFILYVGRHVRYKNIHTLFKIFDKFSERHPDIYLYTIGLHSDYKYYQTLLKLSNNKKIKILGFIENVYDYMNSCRAYVNASLWEGQDLPVIEAQMLGKPVITYNNCSHPETNITGYLANNDDEFAELISKAIYTKIDPRSVIERFSLDRLVDDFEKAVFMKLNRG